MLLQNKSNLINIIKTRNLNVICSSQLADMLSDNILSAVIVDNNSLCRKDIVKRGWSYNQYIRLFKKADFTNS